MRCMDKSVRTGLFRAAEYPQHSFHNNSGVLASATAMDKISSRLIFSSVGISVPPLLALQEGNSVQPADYTGDYVIKPRNDGSSVGVVIVKDGMPAPERSQWANTQLIAEEYIPGRELTVSVLDGRALCVTEIHVPDTYDFDAKYKVGGSTYRACRYT